MAQRLLRDLLTARVSGITISLLGDTWQARAGACALMPVDLAAFAGDDDVGARAHRLARALASAEVSLRAGRRYRRRERGRLTAFPDAVADAVMPRRRGPLIFAAGVLVTEGGPRPCVLALDQATVAASGELARITQEPLVHDVVAAALDEKPDNDTIVVAVPAPSAQFAPGGRVNGVGTSGTLGARVERADGRGAILTAGHVANSGDLVRDESDGLGEVVLSISPVTAAPKAIVADVAVVVPNLPSWQPAPVEISGAAAPEGGSSVTMTGATSGTREAQIQMALTYVWDPKFPGQWGDAYATLGTFSAAGDSGAPVVLSGTDQIIGHLIGASGAFCSYVQDITYQLNATATTLRAG